MISGGWHGAMLSRFFVRCRLTPGPHMSDTRQRNKRQMISQRLFLLRTLDAAISYLLRLGYNDGERLSPKHKIFSLLVMMRVPLLFYSTSPRCRHSSMAERWTQLKQNRCPQTVRWRRFFGTKIECSFEKKRLANGEVIRA